MYVSAVCRAWGRHLRIWETQPCCHEFSLAPLRTLILKLPSSGSACACSVLSGPVAMAQPAGSGCGPSVQTNGNPETLVGPVWGHPPPQEMP